MSADHKLKAVFPQAGRFRAVCSCGWKSERGGVDRDHAHDMFVEHSEAEHLVAIEEDEGTDR